MIKATALFDMYKVSLYTVAISLVLSVFGLLMENERLSQILVHGFKVNYLKAVLACCFILVACLPLEVLSIFTTTIGGILHMSVVRHLFSLWGGILMARALNDKGRMNNNGNSHKKN